MLEVGSDEKLVFCNMNKDEHAWCIKEGHTQKQNCQTTSLFHRCPFEFRCPFSVLSERTDAER